MTTYKIHLENVENQVKTNYEQKGRKFKIINSRLKKQQREC
jgi:hypothetical protein